MPRRNVVCLSTTQIERVTKLWLLRMLVPMGGYSSFLPHHGFNTESVAQAVGLNKWLKPDVLIEHVKVLKDLRRLHLQVERQHLRTGVKGDLFPGTAPLAKLVGLTKTESALLEFAVALHTDERLDTATDYFSRLTVAKLFHLIAVITGLDMDVVKQTLSGNGTLSRSGLLTLDWVGMDPLREKLKLLSPQFAERLRAGETDPYGLLLGLVDKSTPPELDCSDFEHMAPSMKLLRPYLNLALIESRVGVNVLFHGAPGTGKSQLCRVLAQELGTPLFEIACSDMEGNTVSGGGRLRAYRAAQCFFSNSGAFLLFDEIDDVLNASREPFSSEASGREMKGWLNRALETNAVPTFWVTNNVEALDPAFVRRFDLVVKFSVPPRKQREKILNNACEGLLSDAEIKGIAVSDKVTPAVVMRAAKVVRAVRSELVVEPALSSVRGLIDATLEAQGHPLLPRQCRDELPHGYDPGVLNASADLSSIARGLEASRSGRLCLFGPPGTGKSAYGRWLADQLDLPIHVKRASDLLSMWVGGSEKNIADAFRQAERDCAVLLMDEVDSFLQDRQGAIRSWEITLVNELLTQMEQFPGVFIASTNLMEDLDQAAMRRFDLKVRFDYLLSAQAWVLFELHCREMGLSCPSDHHRRGISKLEVLTPGDFAAVARRHRFSPLAGPDGLLHALEEECSIKSGGGRTSIGFKC